MIISPMTFRELLDYLLQFPKVIATRKQPDDGQQPEFTYQGEYTFTGNYDGGLWFVDDTGFEHYLPIDCGKTPVETGVEFLTDRFELTKFGVTFAFFYLGEIHGS